MYQTAKKHLALGALLIVTTLSLTGCNQNHQSVDQNIYTAQETETESKVDAATQSLPVSGWSKTPKWYENGFEEYFVNSYGSDARGYSQCPTTIANGQACNMAGANCQAGYRPSAAVFSCAANYEVHGRVQDIDSGEGIPGAVVIFHTGGSVNVWEGIRLITNSNGEFTLVVSGQPTLAIATRSGYTNGFDSKDNMARGIIQSGSTTIVPMKKATP